MTTGKWKRYLIPGIAFQSVVIGGGYGTGREIVEFFLASGPLFGLGRAQLLCKKTHANHS